MLQALHNVLASERKTNTSQMDGEWFIAEISIYTLKQITRTRTKTKQNEILYLQNVHTYLQTYVTKLA